MTLFQKYRTVIFLIGVALILAILWALFLKDKWLSVSTRTVEIHSLSTMKRFHFKKHSSQGSVHGLELEVAGTSDRTLLFFLGEADTLFNRSVTIKKGLVDFSFTGDWYTDDCFILLPSEPGAKVDLKISYRFLSTK